MADCAIDEQITTLGSVLPDCRIEFSPSKVVILCNIGGDTQGSYEGSIIFSLSPIDLSNTDGRLHIESAEVRFNGIPPSVCATLTDSLMDVVKADPTDLIAAAIFAHGQLSATTIVTKPELASSKSKKTAKEEPDLTLTQLSDRELKTMCILSSETIKVKKSTFFAHTAHVTNVTDVDRVCTFLKASRGLGNATHNIVAYRLCPLNDFSTIEEGFDDDGEHAAGKRLLLLLQKMKVYNRVVLVTRYFGGIQLGPIRFKYINDSAQEAVLLAKKQDPSFCLEK